MRFGIWRWLGGAAFAGIAGVAPDLGSFSLQTIRPAAGVGAQVYEASQGQAVNWVQMGVYAGLAGPSYETPAEIRMLRALGADLVGMSTVLEVIAARHAGIQVAAVSLVTNPGAGLSAAPLDHGHVIAAGAVAAERMRTLAADWAAEVTR